MADVKALTITDAESITDAVLSLVLKYPNYPSSFKASQKNVRINTINSDRSIGIFPMQGAYYNKEYVSGSYQAVFPFRLVYKTNSQANADLMNDQSVVEELSKWLETCKAGFTDEHLTLDEIKRTSFVYVYSQDDTSTQFTCTLSATFTYKN